MAFKLKHVLSSCFCILFLILFLLVLLFYFLTVIPGLSGSHRCGNTIQPPIRPGIGTCSLDLDTLPTYEIVRESGELHTVSRRDLAGDPDALGLIQNPPKAQTSSQLARSMKINVGQASFVASFMMSLYRPPSNQTTTINRQNSTARGITFLVLPHPWSPAEGSLAQQLELGADGSLPALSEVTTGTAPVTGGSGRNVSVDIGGLPDSGSQGGRRPVAHLMVQPSAGDIADAAEANYTVWIEYNYLQQSLSVFVGAGHGNRRPDSAVAVNKHVSYGGGKYGDAYFGLFSSVGQLLQIHTWSTEVEGGPYVLILILSKYMKTSAILFSLILSSVCSAIVVAAATGLACYFRSKHRRWKKEQRRLAETMQRLPGVPTQVDFADIRKATGNFHDEMKLGKGGFSSVYRCKLPAGQSTVEVAVKKFTREVEERRYEDFLAEVSIINRLRHKNVVPLIGWSYSKGVPLLIYEYMTNGSLDQHLFRTGGTGEQPEDPAIRQWHTRYNITRDIATGLHYVHHEHEPMVLHRDIKASNIMLDSAFRARLGDFGIACTVAEDRSSVTGVAGTWGYIAPDYAINHKATRQTDIYAFGVLVLEVVTGRKNMDLTSHDGHISDWVWHLHGEEKLMEAVDNTLNAGDRQLDVFANEAKRLLLLGLACTNPNPSSRPSMAEVVQVITKLAPPPDVPPEKPSFMWPPEEWRSLDDTGCSTTASNLEAWTSSVELVQFSSPEQPPPVTPSTSTSVSV